jgi:hypothetical protein
MIYNKHLYVKRIREVAVRLDRLLQDVVFVGEQSLHYMRMILPLLR